MPGGSTLMTVAPKSERIVVAAGPAMKLATSTTLSPLKMLSCAMGPEKWWGPDARPCSVPRRAPGSLVGSVAALPWAGQGVAPYGASLLTAAFLQWTATSEGERPMAGRIASAFAPQQRAAYPPPQRFARL